MAAVVYVSVWYSSYNLGFSCGCVVSCGKDHHVTRQFLFFFTFRSGRYKKSLTNDGKLASMMFFWEHNNLLYDLMFCKDKLL